MDTPVIAHYHKSNMSFKDYVECVKKDLNDCEFKDDPVENTNYWKCAEWQNFLQKTYKKYAQKCKTELAWDMAVNEAAYAFYMMCHG